MQNIPLCSCPSTSAQPATSWCSSLLVSDSPSPARIRREMLDPHRLFNCLGHLSFRKSLDWFIHNLHWVCFRKRSLHSQYRNREAFKQSIGLHWSDCISQNLPQTCSDAKRFVLHLFQTPIHQRVSGQHLWLPGGAPVSEPERGSSTNHRQLQVAAGEARQTSLTLLTTSFIRTRDRWPLDLTLTASI